MSTPSIPVADLVGIARSAFPASRVIHEPINRDHGSWRVIIGGKEEDLWLEVVWGPLSGFGATDMKNLPGDDPDIFAPFGVPLKSIEDAKSWFTTKTKNA